MNQTSTHNLFGRTRFRRALIAASLLLLAACSSSTEPGALSVRFVVDQPVPYADPATPTVPGSNSGLYQTANSASAPGVIVVLGRVVLPSACYKLIADVQQTGNTLDIRITGRNDGEACTAAVVTQSYSLRIGSLRSGMHHVRVLHVVEGSNPESSLVLERDVYVD